MKTIPVNSHTNSQGRESFVKLQQVRFTSMCMEDGTVKKIHTQNLFVDVVCDPLYTFFQVPLQKKY